MHPYFKFSHHNAQLSAFPTNCNRYVSGTLAGLLLLANPVLVLAHAGHGNEFHQESEATPATSSIQVDTQTAQR